jgi:hypothetical protein
MSRPAARQRSEKPVRDLGMALDGRREVEVGGGGDRPPCGGAA